MKIEGTYEEIVTLHDHLRGHAFATKTYMAVIDIMFAKEKEKFKSEDLHRCYVCGAHKRPHPHSCINMHTLPHGVEMAD